MLVYVIPTQTIDGGAVISPALLPQICAIGIMGLSALLVVSSLGRIRRGEAEAAWPIARGEWAAAAAVIVAVVGAVVLFDHVHPGVATVFVVLSLMLFMGERRWWLLAGLPAVLVAGGYVLFFHVLGMALR